MEDWSEEEEGDVILSRNEHQFRRRRLLLVLMLKGAKAKWARSTLSRLLVVIELISQCSRMKGVGCRT